MAAKIRLKKVGRRGQPSYRVVVLDGRKARDARVVADLGPYDPRTNPPTFEIDGDEALKWLVEGAKPTRAARIILSKAGVMAAWDASKRGETVAIEKKELKPTVKPEKPKAEAPAEEVVETETPAEEAAETEAPAEEPAAVEAEEAQAETEAPAETESAEAETEPEPKAEPETEAPAEESSDKEDEPDDEEK